MANNKSVFIITLLLLVSACASVQKTELSEAESIQAKKFLSSVNGINASSPDTLSSSFTADGNAGEKKFRVEGKVAFDKKGYYKVAIFDYVFKSPVIEAYRELDRLYFYYPAEKRLLTDSADKIDLSMYAGFKTDYKLLYTLLTGGIPLIDKFTIYKCLYDEKEKGHFLILENDDYYENIFFKDGIPEKILFIHKLSKSKAEIYLESIVRKDKSIFFRKYRIVVPELQTAINISFSNPVLNNTVKIDRLKLDKLPAKTEVIKVN